MFVYLKPQGQLIFVTSFTAKVKMSSVKGSLMGAPTDHSDYGTVNKETAIDTVEPPANKVGGLDDTYDGPGSGCVSFHDVSYEVSSCFGRRRKVILNSVR